MKTRMAACRDNSEIFRPEVLDLLIDGHPSPTGLLFRAETNISFIWRVCTSTAPLSSPEPFCGTSLACGPVGPDSFLYGSPFIPTSASTRAVFALSIYGPKWAKHVSNAADRLQIIRDFYGLDVSGLRLMLLAINPAGLELELGMDRDEVVLPRVPIPHSRVFVLSNHPELMQETLRKECAHYGNPFPEGVDRDFLDYSVRL